MPPATATTRQITAQSEGAALVDFFKLPAYPRSTPGNYNAYLTRILNSVAEAGDDFDSDDSNGSSIGYGESNEYGQGVFTLARTPLDAARTFARARAVVVHRHASPARRGARLPVLLTDGPHSMKQASTTTLRS